MSIHQKSPEPSFWEMIDSFVLVAYASLAASRSLLQRLLACQNFTLKSEKNVLTLVKLELNQFVTNFTI